MRGAMSMRMILALATLPLMALAACGDADRTEPALPAEGGLPRNLDPDLALSSDPVDQMNFILGKAARVIPGEPYEVRYQVRRLSGDSISIEFQQTLVGEEWPPAPARAVGLLSEIRAEVNRGRGVEILCGGTACLEYQASVDSLDFPRLPQGPEGDWFRTLVEEMAGGTATVAGAGGEDDINTRLKDSALHYSETVRTWYQVHFNAEWMHLETWQQTQGFPENVFPGTQRIYLPNLEVRGPGVFGCSERPCVLDVEGTPFQVVLESDEDAARFVGLFNGLLRSG